MAYTAAAGGTESTGVVTAEPEHDQSAGAALLGGAARARSCHRRPAGTLVARRAPGSGRGRGATTAGRSTRTARRRAGPRGASPRGRSSGVGSSSSVAVTGCERRSIGGSQRGERAATISSAFAARSARNSAADEVARLALVDRALTVVAELRRADEREVREALVQRSARRSAGRRGRRRTAQPAGARRRRQRRRRRARRSGRGWSVGRHLPAAVAAADLLLALAHARSRS